MNIFERKRLAASLALQPSRAEPRDSMTHGSKAASLSEEAATASTAHQRTIQVQRTRKIKASLLRMRGAHLLSIALVASLAASALHLAPLRSNTIVDNFGLDAFYQVRGPISSEQISKLPQSRDIVSIELPPNFPRRDLALLLAKLRKARVIAIDLMLLDREGMLTQQGLTPTEKQQWYGPEIQEWRRENKILAPQIAKLPQIILGAWPEQERVSTGIAAGSTIQVWRQPAPAIWKAARRSAQQHSQLTVVGDETLSTVRSVRLWESTKTKGKNPRRLPALGLAIAALARGVTPEQFARRVPTNPDGTILISYLGGREVFDGGSNWTTYRNVLGPWLDPDDVKGKIVLIGENSLASKEIKDTPFGPMPGMNIHAMVAATLLSSQGAPRFLPPLWCALLSFACCSLLIVPLKKCAAWSSWLVAALQVIVLFFLGSWLLGHYNVVLPFSLLLMALLLGTFGVTYYEALLARGRLGLVVGTEAKPMMQGFGAGPHLGGHVETAAAFFCDLRNYSDLAATLPLPLLAQLINDYTSTLVNVVRRHGGRPIDFQGDGMFVLFQAKKRERQGEYVRRAVAAALEAQQEFSDLHPHWQTLGIPHFDAAIAVATGPMMIGMVGGEKHLKPGAVGNTVNVAARLQTLSKDCGFNILITQATWEETHQTFPTTPCGPRFIKGHDDPLEIWGMGEPHSIGEPHIIDEPHQEQTVTSPDEATDSPSHCTK